MFEVEITTEIIQKTIDNAKAMDCEACAIHDALKIRDPNNEIWVEFDNIEIDEYIYECSDKLQNWQEELCDAVALRNTEHRKNIAEYPISIIFDKEKRYAKIKGE